MTKAKQLIQSEIQKANSENDASYLLELADILEYIETCEFMRAGIDRTKIKVVFPKEIDDQIPF